VCCFCLFFFSSRRRHTRFSRDWSSDVCSSDLEIPAECRTVQAHSFSLPSASVTSGFVLGSVVHGLLLPVKLLTARLIGKAQCGSPTRSIELDLELPDGLQGPPLVAFPHPQGRSE